MDWQDKLTADKRGAGFGVKGFRGPDLKPFECPACSKLRMLRPLDHQVDYSKRELELGGIVRLVHVDICEFCEQKIHRQIQRDALEKVKKSKVKLDSRENLDENTSLEDIL